MQNKIKIKFSIVAETTMTECLLEPYYERLVQHGVVSARFFLDIKQKFVPYE